MSLADQFSRAKPGDAGIIGDPVCHSLSPSMQNPALRHWDPQTVPVYHTFLVRPDQLEEAVRLIREKKLLGVNVTVPHKEAVCQYLDALDPFAATVRSVNTIACAGGLRGYNTDADGFTKSLEADLGFDARGKSALVLGTGGTGRVLVQRLLASMVKRVAVWNRNADRSLSIEDNRLTRLGAPQEIARESAKVDLIVNATSVGLKEGDAMPVDGLSFNKNQFVFDVVYHRDTEFLKQARARGAKAVNGLGMLLYQGAKAFEIWTGAPAPLDIMKQGLTSKGPTTV